MAIGFTRNSNLSLRVTKGKHAGAIQALHPAPVIVGSSLDADIVLTDGSVLAKHLRLTPGASAAGLEALDGQISLACESLAPGGKAQAAYPFRISLGEAELEVGRTVKFAVLPPAKIGALGAICAIAVALIYLSAPTAGSLPVPLEQAPLAAVPAKAAGPDGELAKAAAAALRERLASLNLDTINVTSSDGAVGATGAIDAPCKDDWHSLEVWFDETYGQSIVLQSAVSVNPEQRAKAPIALQAVWAGKFPYVIDAEGAKHFEGAKIRDGWIIEKIEESGTLLRKGKQALLVKY